MPDWERFVRERLGPLGLAPSREREICAELADHLEDETQRSAAGVLSPAATPVQARDATDWNLLGREIRLAEEEKMTSTAKTIWLPGTSVMLFAAVLLLVMTRLVPPAMWLDGNGPAVLLTMWVLSYIAFGALGAYWSRRAGGDTRARILSGVFPLTLHLAVFFLPIFVTMASSDPRFPEHRQLSYLVGIGTGWVVIPAIVLALGTLPFLRNSQHKAA